MKRFVALLMALALGCSSALSHQGTTPVASTPTQDASVSSDAGLIPTQPDLLGLPTDAGHSMNDVVDLVLTPGQNGEMIVPLRVDASAPFNGVLLNGPAIARVQVEFHGVQERCAVDHAHDIQLYTARYNHDVDSLNLALDYQRRADQILLNSRDQEIARVNRILQDQQNHQSGSNSLQTNLMFLGGGIILGVLVTGAIVVMSH